MGLATIQLSAEWIGIGLSFVGVLLAILSSARAYGRLSEKVDANYSNHRTCRGEMLGTLNEISKDIKNLIAGQNEIRGRFKRERD